MVVIFLTECMRCVIDCSLTAVWLWKLFFSVLCFPLNKILPFILLFFRTWMFPLSPHLLRCRMSCLPAMVRSLFILLLLFVCQSSLCFSPAGHQESTPQRAYPRQSNNVQASPIGEVCVHVFCADLLVDECLILCWLN